MQTHPGNATVRPHPPLLGSGRGKPVSRCASAVETTIVALVVLTPFTNADGVAGAKAPSSLDQDAGPLYEASVLPVASTATAFT